MESKAKAVSKRRMAASRPSGAAIPLESLLEAPLDLAEGSEGVFYASGTPVPQGFAWAAPLPHPELFEGAEVGQHWLLDDGAITVRILAKGPGQVKAEVIIGDQKRFLSVVPRGAR